jgi:hypothetical protein
MKHVFRHAIAAHHFLLAAALGRPISGHLIFSVSFMPGAEGFLHAAEELNLEQERYSTNGPYEAIT